MTWYIEALGLPGPTRNADCGQSRIGMAYCSGRWKQHLSSEFIQVRVRVLHNWYSIRHSGIFYRFQIILTLTCPSDKSPTDNPFCFDPPTASVIRRIPHFTFTINWFLIAPNALRLPHPFPTPMEIPPRAERLKIIGEIQEIVPVCRVYIPPVLLFGTGGILLSSSRKKEK